MKNFLMTVTTLVIMCPVFLGCSTTGTQQPPEDTKIVDLKIPELGTKAEWREVHNGKETIRTNVFTRGEIDGKMSYYWKNLNNNITSIYDLETMNFMGKWSHNNQKWINRFKPHDGNKQYPLWEGKKYKANFYLSSDDGGSGYTKTRVTVEEWETITVPAGTFETIRIVQGNQHYSLTHWYVPELGMDAKYKVSSKKNSRRGELLNVVTP